MSNDTRFAFHLIDSTSSDSLLTASRAESDQLRTRSPALTTAASSTSRSLPPSVELLLTDDGDGGGGGAKSTSEASASETIVFSSLKPLMNVLLMFLSRYSICTCQQRVYANYCTLFYICHLSDYHTRSQGASGFDYQEQYFPVSDYL